MGVIHSCEFVTSHWSVKESAQAYAAIAGVFAAVMLPLLGIVLTNRGSRENYSAIGATVPVFVFGAFVFALTSAFFYGVISGDNVCIRANLLDGPASLLLGMSASLSFVALCWIVKVRHGDERTIDIFGEFALLGIGFASAEIFFTFMQMFLSLRGSSDSWPSNPMPSLLLGCPAAVILLTFMILKFFRVNLERWAHFHRQIFPITYLASIALGLVILNGSYTMPLQSGAWIVVILSYTYLFAIAQAILVACIPRSAKQTIGRNLAK